MDKNRQKPEKQLTVVKQDYGKNKENTIYDEWIVAVYVNYNGGTENAILYPTTTSPRNPNFTEDENSALTMTHTKATTFKEYYYNGRIIVHHGKVANVLVCFDMLKEGDIHSGLKQLHSMVKWSKLKKDASTQC